MELIPNSTCIVCDENTSVLSSTAIEPYIKQIENAFFNDNCKLIQFQEEIANKNFCAVCVQKSVVANRCKDIYENVAKKGYKCPESCFLCEVKDSNFLKINDNPNNVVKKLHLFINNTIYPTAHEECIVCFECFLHLNIWFEMSDRINKKMKSKSKASEKFDQTDQNSSNLEAEVIHKDKENVTPPHNNIQSTSRRYKPGPKRFKEKQLALAAHEKIEKSDNGHDMYKTSKSFRKALKQKLKTFKTLKDQDTESSNWSMEITSDSKMYCQIPYVVMIQKQLQHLQKPSKPSRKSFRQKSMEVIVLSDSDENSSKTGVKQAPKLLIRRPIKISLSKNFSLDPNKKRRTKLTCCFCDKEFYNVCKYKSHNLWHEKPQRLQIDLIQYTSIQKDVSMEDNKENSDITENTDNCIKPTDTCESTEETLNLKETQEDRERSTSVQPDEVNIENNVDANTEKENEMDEPMTEKENEKDDFITENEIEKDDTITEKQNEKDGSNTEIENEKDDSNTEIENEKDDSNTDKEIEKDGSITDKENGNEKDDNVEKASQSDGESSVSANEVQPEEEGTKGDESIDTGNMSDTGTNCNETSEVEENVSRKVMSEEIDTNGIERKDQDAETNSAMFESDDNTTDDLTNTLSHLISDTVQDKSDDEAVGANENGEENGEIDGSEKHGTKRKLDDLSGSVDQNSGDEMTPKRKKVRFALDYSTTKDIEVDDTNASDPTLNTSDNTDSTNDQETAAIAEEV